MASKSSVTVKTIGRPLTVVLEQLSFTVAENDKKTFSRDPGRFLANLLRRSGHRVKSLHMVAAVLKSVKKHPKTRSRKIKTSVWHCVKPPHMACRRIIVTAD